MGALCIILAILCVVIALNSLNIAAELHNISEKPIMNVELIPMPQENETPTDEDDMK